MNKKAQIGSGLAWFVGFIIIFFILIVFVAFSLALAGKRSPGLGEINSAYIESGGFVGNLAYVEEIFAFLNTPTENINENSADFIAKMKETPAAGTEWIRTWLIYLTSIHETSRFTIKLFDKQQNSQESKLVYEERDISTSLNLDETYGLVSILEKRAISIRIPYNDGHVILSVYFGVY